MRLFISWHWQRFEWLRCHPFISPVNTQNYQLFAGVGMGVGGYAAVCARCDAILFLAPSQFPFVALDAKAEASMAFSYYLMLQSGLALRRILQDICVVVVFANVEVKSIKQILHRA